MSIPEGYEKLAVVGIAYKGEYDANTSYKTMNAIYHEGSTYVALRDNPVGTPSNDSADWMYLAKGFTAHLLSEINATDTSGLLGEAGASVGAQALIDTIADKVATKLLLKSDVVSQIIDDATKAASMAALYDVNQRVDELNSNLTGKLPTSTFNTHKTSGDHDGRYYTETEINDKLTMKELSCNVIPTTTDTNYSYQNNTLKNRGFVVAYFPNSVGTIYIPAGKFAEGVLNVREGDQFWGGEIDASYNASTGTVTFRAKWIGASQNIGNFGLKAVNYM